MSPSRAEKWRSLREVTALIWVGATRFVKVRLALALLIVAASSIVTALGPVALKLVLDALTTRSEGPRASLPLLLVLYVVSHWLARALTEVRSYVHAQADRRMFRSLCDRLFDHVMQLPLRYHMNRQTGVMTGTLQNGLQGYQMIFQTLVMTLLPVLLEIGTVAVVLVSLKQSVYLALFCVAMVCYGIAFTWGAVRIMGSARAASTSQADAWGVLTDSILNYEAVKYFTAEATVRERFDRSLFHTESEWMRFYRLRALIGLLIATIFAAFLAVAVFYAASQVQAGAMTIGTFVLIHTYMFRLVQPLEMIGYAMQQLSQGFAFLEKLLEIFRETPEPTTAKVQALPSGPGRLEFRNVSLAYRAERPILKDVSFEIPAGKTLGVVGASGAGKSTLVRLLVRLVEPDSGQILLDGVPLSDLPLPRLRQAIAVVPQDTVLFNDSILYNIGFGKVNSTQEEVERAARLAHLHDFVMSLPDKYETKVGERGVKLSGGEKQRVSIARAAIKQPRIYVFDEATSSLDSRTEGDIMHNLRELSRDSTTLVIAHRLSTVVHADEIVVLEGGVIVERGTHFGLLHQNGRYARLWEAQQQTTAKVKALA
ncbi:MAG TPA: ATP-binding cassette domain-containing protein [Steroidobacteraceae bacterium]|nr:ATP-binding cassette domain-containing protein [Steroidobacteraceae bacterium]